MIPNSVTDMLKNDKYQLLLVNSEYKVASDELNDQIKDLNKILHKYDKGGMLIGEVTVDSRSDRYYRYGFQDSQYGIDRYHFRDHIDII